MRKTKTMIAKINWKFILYTENMILFNICKALGCLLFLFFGCGVVEIKLIAQGHVTSK